MPLQPPRSRLWACLCPPSPGKAKSSGGFFSKGTTTYQRQTLRFLLVGHAGEEGAQGEWEGAERRSDWAGNTCLEL